MRKTFLLSVMAFSAVAATDLLAVQTPLPSCDQSASAVRVSPDNLEAAANFGRCAVRDYELVAPSGDSTRLAFRTSWGPALRVLRRAVAADPTYARAYTPLFRMLFADTRDGCSRVTGECRYVAPILRRGDSVVTPPRLVERRPPPDTIDTYDEAIAESRATERESLVEARSLAERWLSVAPNDRRPHEYLGRALLLLGDSVGASNAFERAAELGTPESRRAMFWDRFTALVKANRGADARRVLEEAASDAGRDTMRLRARTIAALHGLLGQHRPLPIDSARWRADSIRFAEIRRRRPPDTTKRTRQRSFEELIAAGDTANAQRLATRIDSLNAPPEPGMMRIPPVDQYLLHSAKRHLALRDTARAEAQLAPITGLLDQRKFEFNRGLVFGDPRPWMGHAWALSGDIAAARGRTDDAARMYRRVIGLWEGGDPDTKPVVEHARTRLAALPRR